MSWLRRLNEYVLKPAGMVLVRVTDTDTGHTLRFYFERYDPAKWAPK